MDEKLLREARANLDRVIKHWERLLGPLDSEQYDDITISEIYAFLSSAKSVIEQVSGTASKFSKEVDDVVARDWTPAQQVSPIAGIARGLREAVEAGFLESFDELVHAELFTDYLDMAEHLLEEGYKDPAAVVVGSSLEIHLKKLCSKHNIAIVEQKANGEVPLKAARLNEKLAKQGVYGKGELKLVTAWLDTRNASAHGHYDQYDADRVRNMLIGVRAFIARHPA